MQLSQQDNRKVAVEKFRLKQGTQMILLSIPLILLIFAFNYMPLFGWVYAFFDYKPGVPLTKSVFVGLKNFTMMFTTSKADILRVMGNTLAISFFVILSTPLPAIFAIMINELKNKKFKTVIQTVATLPNFISWVTVFSLFFAIFSTDGAVNTLMAIINPSGKPSNILANADFAWVVQVAILTWKTLGWNAIIYLAAITGIDSELYDAAAIDGAGKLAAIRYVTIPGIIETYFVLLLLTISGMLTSGMEQYLMFMNPVVQDKLEVLDYYVYRLGVTLNDVSFSTAIGIMKTFVSVGLLFGVNFLSKKARGNSLI